MGERKTEGYEREGKNLSGEDFGDDKEKRQRKGYFSANDKLSRGWSGRSSRNTSLSRTSPIFPDGNIDGRS